MRVYVYPSDEHGCGHYRMIYPAEELARQGMDVQVVRPSERWNIKVKHHPKTGVVHDAYAPDDADVIVMQRITHAYLVQAIPILREKGIAVVMDVDDDLSTIHPGNPAFSMKVPLHRWSHLKIACQEATLTTVSSAALANRYGRTGATTVVRNYLPDQAYETTRSDSRIIGWPAVLHSHPNDPPVVGSSLHRLMNDDPSLVFRTFQPVDKDYVEQLKQVFNVPRIEVVNSSTFEKWPTAVAELGIGIAPLADTKFNEAKSWLKPLEMSAAGVPWVASDRAEYRAFRDQSKVGILASKPNQWYTALRRLVQDDAYRQEASEEARVASEAFRIRDHAYRWAEAWEQAYKIQRG